MIPVYLDVSNEAKRQINENVWCMFDLLEATCEGLSYEEILDGIFPPYIVLKLERPNATPSMQYLA